MSLKRGRRFTRATTPLKRGTRKRPRHPQTGEPAPQPKVYLIADRKAPRVGSFADGLCFAKGVGAMTTATWNKTDANWFVSANWDEPGPLHQVPGASDDVFIPDNSPGTPFTVTYNGGTSTVNSLQGANAADTLNIATGSLTLANGGPNNGMNIDVASGA